MLKQRILDDIKAAMKGGDKPRLGALRLVSAAIKQREVDERIELDDTQVMSILEKMIKQRRESLAQYEKAGRDDLAAQERFEIEVCQAYLPEALSAEALDGLIRAALEATGASGPRDMGKVIAHLRPQVQGRADMGAVSQAVKALLGG